MARPYFVKDIYVNGQKRILVDASGNPLASADVPEFFREETILLRFHVVDANGLPWPFNATDAFEFGADPDYNQATAVDLLSENDQFNLAGDWVDAEGNEITDPSQGLICCRVNTNTSPFNTTLGTAAEVLSGCYLKVCTDLITPAWATIFDGDCSYRNIRRTNALVPEYVTGPTYLTAAQTAALFNSSYPTNAKATPVDADGFSLWDSAAAFFRKIITWAEIVAAMQTVLEAAYGLLATADAATLTGGVASDADSLHTHGGLVPASEKGAANGVAPLDASSKISSTYLPAIAIVSVTVVANEAAQLALTAEQGDVAVRSDENKSYIHNGGTAADMTDWTLLKTPTDLVLSVAGETGAISKSALLAALNVEDGAQVNAALASDSEADTGTETAARSWSPVLIFRAIAAKVLALFGSDGKLLYRAAGALATLTLRTSVRATGTADDTSVVTEAAARAMLAAGHTIAGTFTAGVLYALTSGGTWTAFDPATHAGRTMALCGTTNLLTLPGVPVTVSGASWSPGGAVYASDTAGALTQTRPETYNICVVGMALSATSVLFTPYGSWGV